VIEMATANPSRAMPFPELIGTLRPGAAGDAVVLALREGDFRLRDSRGVERFARQKIEPVQIVRAGRVYDPQSWHGPFGHEHLTVDHLDKRGEHTYGGSSWL
jgi:predicted amidohydrolase